MIVTIALAAYLTSGSLTNDRKEPYIDAYSLRCEYLENPIGVDTPKPRLSWKLKSKNQSLRGQKQTGYRILVASNRDKLDKDQGDLWDSGAVSSDQNTFITYDGKPLYPGQRAYWKVQLANGTGISGNWSLPGQWTARPEWTAQWIKFKSDVADSYKQANNGYHSTFASGPNETHWVQIDLGSSQSINRIKLHPAQPFDFTPTPGFLFPVRFKIDVSDDPTFAKSTRFTEFLKADFANPGSNRVQLPGQGTGRYVRLTVTKLAQRDEKVWAFALAEMEVFSGDKNVAEGCPVSADSSTESNSWGTTKLTDGDRISHDTVGAVPLAANYFRREFDAKSGIKRATLFMTALGVYEAYINGQRVGQNILAPEWTTYQDRVQYQGYDVTNLVRRGKNCVGAVVGSGWYSGRIAWFGRYVYGRQTALLGQLEIEFNNGEKEVISTDTSWTSTNQGPINKNDILDGDEYQAGYEKPGWNAPDYVSPDWKPVVLADKSLPKEIVAQPNEPIRPVQTLTPISVTLSKSGSTIVDFGQNMVGWARVRCKSAKDGKITVRYGEVLNEDGSVYYDNLRGAPQIDTYTAAKPGFGVYEPHFTYHGFRYVEIIGSNGKIDKSDVKGIVFCSSSPETAQFECSDPMINRLWKNIFWTQRANLMSTPTDCPQRDERLGWMGDIQAFAQTACYNMNMNGFFAKWMQDVRDSQSSEGLFPEFCPFPPNKENAIGSPAWSDAGVFVPWTAYLNYGDRKLLEDHFESAKRYVDFLHRNNPNGLWLNRRGNDFNDWLNGDTLDKADYPKTGGAIPCEVLGSAFMARSTEIVSEMAKVLGKDADAKKYGDLAAHSRKAFNEAYVDKDGKIKGETQAGYALALSFNLLPERIQPKAVSNLKEAIAKYNDHISTGIQTTHHMMRVLSDFGASDLAYKLLMNRTFPSWGYTIDNGATTIWERWDGYVKGRGFQNPGMNSMNHWALGAVGEWIARNIGGIAPGDEPGWKHPVIRPVPGGGISHASMKYDSINGPIECQWSLDKGVFKMNVSIPIGVKATVCIPAKSIERVVESGKAAAMAPNIHFLGIDGDYAFFEVESGTYSFTSN